MANPARMPLYPVYGAHARRSFPFGTRKINVEGSRPVQHGQGLFQQAQKTSPTRPHFMGTSMETRNLSRVSIWLSSSTSPPLGHCPARLPKAARPPARGTSRGPVPGPRTDRYLQFLCVRPPTVSAQTSRTSLNKRSPLRKRPAPVCARRPWHMPPPSLCTSTACFEFRAQNSPSRRAYWSGENRCVARRPFRVRIYFRGVEIALGGTVDIGPWSACQTAFPPRPVANRHRPAVLRYVF